MQSAGCIEDKHCSDKLCQDAPQTTPKECSAVCPPGDEMCGNCALNPTECSKYKPNACAEPPNNRSCEVSADVGLLANIYSDALGNIFIECCGKTISLEDYTAFTGKQFPDKYVKMVKE
jgi:hypothetical protein